jgi:hypothetical protein
MKNKISTSALDRRTDNMSTVVPRESSTRDNILEVDSLFTKSSVSPYKQMNLPALNSQKNIARIAGNYSGKKNI